MFNDDEKKFRTLFDDQMGGANHLLSHLPDRNSVERTLSFPRPCRYSSQTSILDRYPSRLPLFSFSSSLRGETGALPLSGGKNTYLSFGRNPSRPGEVHSNPGFIPIPSLPAKGCRKDCHLSGRNLFPGSRRFREEPIGSDGLEISKGVPPIDSLYSHGDPVWRESGMEEASGDLHRFSSLWRRRV